MHTPPVLRVEINDHGHNDVALALLDDLLSQQHAIARELALLGTGIDSGLTGRIRYEATAHTLTRWRKWIEGQIDSVRRHLEEEGEVCSS